VNETYEISSVTLVMRPTAGNSIREGLAALMSSTTYLAYTQKANTVITTIHMDGSNKPYATVVIKYPLSSTDEITKTGLSSCEPKTSCEPLLPHRPENGDPTYDLKWRRVARGEE
jgi:hypothetical protein